MNILMLILTGITVIAVIVGLMMIVRHFYITLFQKPDYLELAEESYSKGNFREAVVRYRQALLVNPDCAISLNNLAFILATAPDDSLRNGEEAVRLAQRAMRLPPIKGMCVEGTLAAAYAEAGRYAEAVATTENAVRTETAAGETRYADRNRKLLTLYSANKPWHGTLAEQC